MRKLTKIKKLIDLISELTKLDTTNFYNEVKLGTNLTGKEFTDTVKNARKSNDERAIVKNEIEDSLLEILQEEGHDVKNVTGNIAESFSFLIDVFIVNHSKVWFSEQEIRELNKLENPDPTRVNDLVDYSRQANDNRIKIRDLLSRKLTGILTGTEGVGDKEPKLFKAEKRN